MKSFLFAFLLLSSLPLLSQTNKDWIDYDFFTEIGARYDNTTEIWGSHVEFRAEVLARHTDDRGNILYFSLGINLGRNLSTRYSDRIGVIIKPWDRFFIYGEVGELTHMEDLYFQAGVGIPKWQLFCRPHINDQRLVFGLRWYVTDNGH